MQNTHPKVSLPSKGVFRREACGHQTKSDLDRLAKNRNEKNHIADLLRRCIDYRSARITFERYQADVASIVRRLSKQLMKALTKRWGKPDSLEFASAFAA